MATNRIRIVLIMLVVASLVAVFGLSPASAAIQATTVTPTTAKTSVPAQATATITPTVAAPTATKTSVPAATATKTTPATATKTAVPSATAVKTAVPSATATKVVATATVTPTKTVVATATRTPTKVVTATATVTPTKVATPTRVPTATPTVVRRAPRAGTVSSISTAFVLQNIDPSNTANISATFYNVSGAVSSVITRNINPNLHTIVDQRSDSSLGTTFQGSVVVSSTTQLASVVNQYSGNSTTLGVDFRADSYNGVPSSQATQSVLLPQLLKNITDTAQQKTYNSTIAIQNTSSSATANVVITYTNILIGGNPTSTHSGISIPPGSSVFVDMSNEVPTWSTFFGPATVTADQNIAVIVNQNAAGSLLVYRGFTAADGHTSILVTQALTNIYDSGQQLNYGSAVEGMVVNGSSVVVTVNYTNLLNGVTKSCTLPSGNTFRVDMRPGYWPSGCTPPVNGSNQFFGTIQFTASTPILALSNLQSDFSVTKGIRASTSRAFVTSGTGTTAYAPFLMNAYFDAGTNVTWGTALEGRLLTGTGTVTITYYSSSGTTYTDTYNTGSGQIFRFDQRLANPQTGFTLPSGFVGSAVITAPQAFVFTVNAQGTAATLGDALTVYMSQ